MWPPCIFIIGRWRISRSVPLHRDAWIILEWEMKEGFHFFFGIAPSSTTLKPAPIRQAMKCTRRLIWSRTWGQALLELFSLLWVVHGKSVQVSWTPHFEFSLDLPSCWFCGNFFDTGLWIDNTKISAREVSVVSNHNNSINAREASFRRAISMNCLISLISLG